tara:strand:- start:27323 stop:27856 length:534 start_codon:yes stop_codon:yes gene_type:complete
MILNEKHFSKKVYDLHQQDRSTLEKNILKLLNIELKYSKLPETTKSLLILNTNPEDFTDTHTLHLNKNNTIKENNTLIFINCSKFIFKYKEYTINQKLEIDSFELSEIKDAKYSKVIQLATRLAIPEKDVNDLLKNDYNIREYSKKYNLLESFSNCLISNNNLRFIIGINDLFQNYS